MTNYQGKDIVIVGLGLTGLSCVDFFLSRGVTPKVMDTRTSPPASISCRTAFSVTAAGLKRSGCWMQT